MNTTALLLLVNLLFVFGGIIHNDFNFSCIAVLLNAAAVGLLLGQLLYGGGK